MSPVDSFYNRLPKLQEDFKAKVRKSTRFYFTKITEEAICAYNVEPDQSKRNKIYNEHIHRPLFKLSENIINRFKFYYMDGKATDVKYEVVTFLLEKMPKYTQDKGAAFSYLSIVAKNYLIQNNNKQYKKLKQKASLNVVDRQRNISTEGVYDDYREGLKAFMDSFIEYYDSNVEKFHKNPRDQRIAYAVLHLFNDRQNIEKFNKKAIYLLVREMTNCETQFITRVVNNIKREYVRLYELFENGRFA
mgnify:CR=1 FL=1